VSDRFELLVIGGRTLKYAAWGDGHDEVRFAPGADGGFTAWYGRDGRIVGMLAHDAGDAGDRYEQGQALISEGAAWS